MDTEKKLDGALIGLIIIIIVLVIGGVYIWRSKVKQMEIQKTQNTNVGVDANTVK